MINAPSILSISGTDSTGQSGISADIQTIAALGGQALTAITSVGTYALPTEVVTRQVFSIIGDSHPQAIKVGLVRSEETVRALSREIIACRKLVIAPGIYSSDGLQMVSDEVVQAIAHYLVPIATLLMLRCRDAEKMLHQPIKTDDDMLLAARQLHEMGAQWVLLRGGQHVKGRITALLSGIDSLFRDKGQGARSKRIPNSLMLPKQSSCPLPLAPCPQTFSFFTSYNTDGWQRHGVAGALSAAVTTRLAVGDDVPTALRNAHDFIHSQVVYAKEIPILPSPTGEGTGERLGGSSRAIDIYNAFVSLVAEHYARAHDVSFYASRLCITPRYLSQVTDRVVGKAPKQIISDYLMSEARSLLRQSRLTMQEIAIRLGFTSGAQFSKFFHQQQGISPITYRHGQ